MAQIQLFLNGFGKVNNLNILQFIKRKTSTSQIDKFALLVTIVQVSLLKVKISGLFNFALTVILNKQTPYTFKESVLKLRKIKSS